MQRGLGRGIAGASRHVDMPKPSSIHHGPRRAPPAGSSPWSGEGRKIHFMIAGGGSTVSRWWCAGRCRRCWRDIDGPTARSLCRQWYGHREPGQVTGSPATSWVAAALAHAFTRARSATGPAWRHARSTLGRAYRCAGAPGSYHLVAEFSHIGLRLRHVGAASAATGRARPLTSRL